MAFKKELQAKPITLTEVWSRYHQLHAEAHKLIRDRARELLNKVPESCDKFVAECCSGWEVGAFTDWLGQLVENTAHHYGCDANMHVAPNRGLDVYGFKNSEEALVALKELEVAWEGAVTVAPEVLTYNGEVYRIDVLCKAVIKKDQT